MGNGFCVIVCEWYEGGYFNFVGSCVVLFLDDFCIFKGGEFYLLFVEVL